MLLHKWFLRRHLHLPHGIYHRRLGIDRMTPYKRHKRKKYEYLKVQGKTVLKCEIVKM